VKTLARTGATWLWVARTRGLAGALAAGACASALCISVATASGTGGQEATPAPGVGTASTFAVGLRVLRLVDPSRTIHLAKREPQPRTLVTYVRYPALGAPTGTDVPNAPAASTNGPFPLVVFAHGFAVTPATYARLLQSGARAGYVVAAPVFPLENAHAPGGPDESDLINEPADMSFVISHVLAESAARSTPLAGLVDRARVAVAGQSDGGVAALAVAFSRRFRDARVRAAMILSGAEMSGVGGYDAAHRPKYLMRLLGAKHLSPYTTAQPQLSVVERVTIAFLDGYLKETHAMLRRLVALGDVPAVSALVAVP
jgi:dienelactone hydrolase